MNNPDHKKVLLIYYSQSGQLLDILNNICKDLGTNPVQIDHYCIKPQEDFPFPWPKDVFYDAFPESFLQRPIPLEAPEAHIMGQKYDLIILGYQVWYLSPSIPINSFLKSPAGKQILSNTPVITVVACRNMWIMAQEKVKALLQNAEAQLVGHLAFTDRAVNNISVLTIKHWMFGGKKTRMWGIFPKPGVSDADIEEAKRFGLPIRECLLNNSLPGLQHKLKALGGVRVNPYLIATDKRGNFVFSKWSKIIDGKGPKGSPARKKWLGYFKYYLLFAIWVIAPLVYVVHLLTYIPLWSKIKREKEYYSSVELKNA